ncbi:PilZ domain-containing protein [Phenylobacterium montanum]|uniref:PilZ domain-containing protein n=1 Tax=Phenylobacterium montanum TaxID=2823693 RepID=A0A975IU60_9CAUL|nr:PilZ domain-containing protein [Caulobacter sp. S6]QUD87420.1 PilZ domain-containing protein [Caulobacter sp. S6]
MSSQPLAFAPDELAAVRARSERRLQERRAANWSGRIADEQRAVSYDCEVTNISETGARISISGAGELPNRMVLEVAQLGPSRPARLVWQFGRDAGLTFEN